MYLQPCKLPADDADGSKLVCRMPAVSLPGALSYQLNKSKNGVIDDRGGYGVAVYRSLNGTRADIYVGLALDGYYLYRNISSVEPTIKMQFALQPNISCPANVLTFTPGTDDTIAIQVQGVNHWSYTCVLGKCVRNCR